MRAGPLRPKLRRETMVRLAILNEPEALKQLNAAAQDKTSEARNEALGILAVAQHAGSFDRLYDAAVWVRGGERLLLAEALAEAGDSRASQLLKPFVKEPEPKVRRRAVAALGLMANAGRLPDYIAFFEPLLADSDPKVAMLATVSLIQ
jgi:HEAT repeat protein